MDELLTNCPACGTQAVPGAIYCHRCGAPLIGDELLGEGGDDTFEEDEAPAPDEFVAGDPAFPGVEEDPGPAGVTGAVDPGAASRAGVAGAAPSGDAAAGAGSGSAFAGGTSAPGAPGSASAGGTGAASAAGTAAAADPALARALRGEYEVRMGDWMTRGWAVFTHSGGLFVVYATIVWLVSVFATPILLILLPIIASGFLAAGLVARRGETVQFSDFWLPFNDFLPLFLAWIVSCALLFAGLITCGVVTVYLWVGYQFVYLLILDRRMDFWDALEASRKAVSRHWFCLFAFAVILLAINLVALAVATVGVILSLPLTSCFLVEAYADIFGVRGGLRRQPEPLRAPAVASAPAAPVL